MPVKPPDGCLTRPEAARQFNRSQRALERDLNLAVSIGDTDVLDHWYLVTKDGDWRRAAEVETEEVKQLVSDGMTPTWYVEELWLEQEYGRKGTAESSALPVGDLDSLPIPVMKSQESEQHSDPDPDPPWEALLAPDIEILVERIRTLEKEKQEEAARAEKREARLYEQLTVKDGQIKSWDEITQGLTRGLATGQLVLNLPTESASGKPHDTATPKPQPARSVTPIKNEPPAKRTQPRKKNQTKKKAKASSKSTAKPSASKSGFAKHTPTFYKAAVSLLRRS